MLAGIRWAWGAACAGFVALRGVWRIHCREMCLSLGVLRKDVCVTLQSSSAWMVRLARAVVVALFALIPAVSIASSISSASRASSVSDIPLVAVAAVAAAGEAALVPGRVWRGVFEPRREATLPAEVSMPVARLHRQPGESCAEGDLLVEFDATLSQAALSAARAANDAARLNQEGLFRLHEKGQAAPTELAQAVSELEKSRLQLATAMKDAAACSVSAPFAGRIADSKVREHEWASRGSPLVTLVDDAVLRARFFLPEEMFSRISLGDRVAIRTPAADVRVEGTVSRIGVVFDPASRTFDVWADVDNAAGTLRAGMTAEIIWPREGMLP